MKWAALLAIVCGFSMLGAALHNDPSYEDGSFIWDIVFGIVGSVLVIGGVLLLTVSFFIAV